MQMVARLWMRSGMLASPLFIDPHHHLDCAFLSEPPNLSGTLEEAIQINARLKQSRSDQDIFEKACRRIADGRPKWHRLDAQPHRY